MISHYIGSVRTRRDTTLALVRRPLRPIPLCDSVSYGLRVRVPRRWLQGSENVLASERRATRPPRAHFSPFGTGCHDRILCDWGRAYTTRGSCRAISPLAGQCRAVCTVDRSNSTVPGKTRRPIRERPCEDSLRAGNDAHLRSNGHHTRDRRGYRSPGLYRRSHGATDLAAPTNQTSRKISVYDSFCPG